MGHVIRNTSYGNGATPVSMQMFGLTVDVYLTANDTPVGGVDGQGNAIPQEVPFTANTDRSGGLVIRGYSNTHLRNTLNGNKPSQLRGMFLESTDLRSPLVTKVGNNARFVLPYEVIQEKVANGGVLRVYVYSTKSYTSAAAGAVVFKDGLEQVGVSSTGANDGSVWAIYEPAATVKPIVPPTYLGTLQLTGTVHGVATTGALSETQSPSTSITINWGDGTAAQTINHGDPITHTYAAAGSFTVTATATVTGMTGPQPITVTPTPLVVT